MAGPGIAVTLRRAPGRPGPGRPALLCGALLAVAVVWFGTSAAGLTPARWGAVVIPVSMVVAAVGAATASRSSARGTAGRRFWYHVTVTLVLAAAGCVLRAYHILTGADLAEAQYHTPDMLLQVAAVGVQAWAMIRLPLGLRSRVQRWAFGLDVCTVLAAAGLFWWMFVFRSVVVESQNKGLIFALVAVAASQVVLFGLIKVAMTGSRTLNHHALRLMGVALVIAAILSVGDSFLVKHTELTATQLSLPLAACVVALAARQQFLVAGVPQPVQRRRQRAFSILPYLAVAAIDALLLISTGYAGHHERLTAAVGAVAVTFLVVARQILTFRENRSLQRRLVEQANHDTLTGLANRALFNQLIERALATPATAAATAVLLVDLNEFKGVNDSFGHAVGDVLLVTAAQRLRAVGPPGSTVARLGGDEFALLVTGTTPERATVLAGRIVRAFEPPVPLPTRDLPLAASIGFAVAWAGADPDELLRRADVAMYAAKSGGERGRTRFAGYTSSLDHEFTARGRLAEDLRRALAEGELVVRYQPIVSLETGRPVAVEALARWTHPGLGPVSPTVFVPVAERTGLIVPMGLWILRSACAQAAAWHRKFGAAAPTVSVNVSARQLRDDMFVDHVATLLVEHDLPPARLTVEITESMAIADPAAHATVAALHELGVRVSLDDFGTGYSALSVLDQCPADELKLDWTFTRTCVEPDRRRVVTAVLEVARALHLEVVAEGVETRAEADQLMALGYRLAQGYLYAPALPAGDVTALVADGHRTLGPDGATVSSVVAP